MVTQTICGLWHGLSPSFVLFFGHSAMLIYCSRVLYKIQTQYMSKETLPYTNFLHSCFTLFMLSYIAGAYNVSTLKACMDWWSSVAFIGHYMIAGCFVLLPFFPSKKGKKA